MKNLVPVLKLQISNEFRNIVSNAIPNHITGSFPNSGNPHTITEQNKIWKFPLNGIFTGTPKDVREPGVALNGINKNLVQQKQYHAILKSL